jgi:DNA-binding NtrC family response regulator
MVEFRIVLLTKNPALKKTVADWRLTNVELMLFDSPSDALAHLSDGNCELFVFDTNSFRTSKHIVDKFLTLRGDADLIVIGNQSLPSESSHNEKGGVVRRLPLDVAENELKAAVDRLLRLRAIRIKSGIVGRSRAVNQMISLIAQAAPLDVSILILGESGTGKELVANSIHQQSSRSTKPFISLNCGAFSEGLLESELFGHKKGSFTGAIADHAGVFAQASGGTLFLDEVAELSLAMQTRFLRALETGDYVPVGGTKKMHSDIRLIAATHRDLAKEVEAGNFRQDLYYRLRVVVIPTPPLRDRTEDIPVITETFLRQENKTHKLNLKGFSRRAQQMLEKYSWPGNIRELRNLISSLVVIKQTGMIEPSDLPSEFHDINIGHIGHNHNLPVLVGNRQDLGLELMAATLLEMREDIKQIKATLEGLDISSISGSNHGQILETFSGDLGFITEPAAGENDLQTAEKVLIEQALQSTFGKRRQASQKLGISERTLYRKIKKYNLD